MNQRRTVCARGQNAFIRKFEYVGLQSSRPRLRFWEAKYAPICTPLQISHELYHNENPLLGHVRFGSSPAGPTCFAQVLHNISLQSSALRAMHHHRSPRQRKTRELRVCVGGIWRQAVHECVTMTMTMTLREVQPSVDRGLALQASV